MSSPYYVKITLRALRNTMLVNRLSRIHPFLLKKLQTSALAQRLASGHGHDKPGHTPEPLVRKGDAHDDHGHGHHGHEEHYTLKHKTYVDPYVHHEHDDPGPPATLDYAPIPFKSYQSEYDHVNKQLNVYLYSSVAITLVLSWIYIITMDGFDFFKDPTWYVPSFAKRGKPGYETAFLTFEEWNKFMPPEFQKTEQEVYGEEEAASEEAGDA